MIDFEISIENEPRAASIPSKQGANIEQTSALENSVLKLSGQLSTITRQQKYFRTRENRNFSTVRSTEQRIFNFSIIESLMMVAMAGLQVFIVRIFFQTGRKGEFWFQYPIITVNMLTYTFQVTSRYRSRVQSLRTHIQKEETLYMLAMPFHAVSCFNPTTSITTSHETVLPSSMTIYSSPTIIFISSSTMKLSWSPVKALLAGSYMNRAKAL
jgi:hypothetical protein